MRSAQITIDSLKNPKLAKGTWGVLQCKIDNKPVLQSVKSSSWPMPANELMCGMMFRASVKQETGKYGGQLLACEMEPADPKLFRMVKELLANDKSLRKAIAKLMKTNGGLGLREAAHDAAKLQTLLKVTREQALRALSLCSTIEALDAQSSVPEEMRRELKGGDAGALKANPFHLCIALRDTKHKPQDVLRVADKLARAAGLSTRDPRRVKAHLELALRTLRSSSCSEWLEAEAVVEEAERRMRSLWPDKQPLDAALRCALSESFPCEGKLVTVNDVAERERFIASELARISRLGPPSPEALKLAEGTLAGDASCECAGKLLALDATQREAVLLTLSNPVSIITGGAGAGKSSVVAVVESLLREAGCHPSTCAPTGKAATRCFELTGHRASTIHSMVHQKHTPTHAIIDETSMVSPSLLHKLLTTKGRSLRMLIFCGDAAQLPSISPGALLRDLIASCRIPTIKLTTIHRSGSGSVIAQRAQDIANGRSEGIAPCESEAWTVRHYSSLEGCIQAATSRGKELLSANAPTSIVLAQKRDTCRSLNLALQSAANPPSDAKPEIVTQQDAPPWRVGDAVIATETESNPQPPFERLYTNGDMGTISEVNVAARRFCVTFGAGHSHEFSAATSDVLHSYAMTVHRYQGSEAAHVVIVIDMHSSYQSREALYTAATRGAASVAIHGGKDTLSAALKQSSNDRRCTMLRERLVSALAKRPRE